MKQGLRSLCGSKKHGGFQRGVGGREAERGKNDEKRQQCSQKQRNAASVRPIGVVS